MKKIYLSILAVAASTAMIAQTNLSFENWDTGEVDDWDYYGAGVTSNGFSNFGDLTDQNGDPVTPIVEMNDVPTDGNSYVRMTSFELSNSNNANLPDGPYGSLNFQTFASTDKYEDISLDVKYDLIGSDIAVVFIQANDADGDAVGQGILELSGSEANFTNETVAINYFSGNAVVGYEIILASSISEVFASLNGNPTPAAEPGSVLDADNIVIGDVIIEAPNVSNVVASDISDNCDGSDLEVSFEVPADESDIANYYVLVTTPDITPGALNDPLTVFQTAGVQIAPNGSNQTHTFSAGDDYYFVDNGNLDAAAITNGVELIVHVYVEGQSGFNDIYSQSNDIELDCPTSSVFENEIETVNVYPNPASNKVNFDFGNNTIESLTVTDMNGRTITTVSGNNSLVTVDVNGLENGIYFYNAVDNTGNVISANKFVVNH